METAPPGTDKGHQGWFGKNLRRNFLAGLLVLVPIAIVTFVILWFFHTIDGILQPIIRIIFGRTITGLGFAITFVLIYLVGILASNIVGRRVIQFGEWLVGKLPVLGQLYNAAKQAMSSISGLSRTKAAFREVVLIEYPRKGLRSIGFVTNEILDSEGRQLTAVYLPSTPVPTSGWIVLVTEDQLIRTNISVDTAMKMVISGGIAAPPELGATICEPVEPLVEPDPQTEN